MPEAEIKTAYIYGLADPRNNCIKYIGKSIDPRKRLREHLQSWSLDRNYHKDRWIKLLSDLGIKPIFIIIAKVDEPLSFEMEKIVIKNAKDAGWPLTNLTDGGEGFSSYVMSDARKEKMRQYHLGRRHSEETKKRMSIAHLGKRSPYISVQCQNCFNPFDVLVSTRMAGRGLFCCKRCQAIAMAKRRWGNQ